MKTRLQSILERVVSYGLAIGAAIGLVYFQTHVDKTQKAAVRAKQEELRRYQEQIAAAQHDLVERQRQIEQINKQIAERRREIVEKFERILEKASNYPVFIEQIQRKAKTLNVTILNSRYEAPKHAAGTSANYLEFRFTLDLMGPYENIKQFLWEVENTLGRLVKITSMTLKSPIVDKEGNMQLTLTLATFFLP